MANSFDRMLFLTATPFQLGHKELVQVLRRFGDIRWTDPALGERDDFMKSLDELHHALDESQRTSIELQRAWSRMRPEELPPSPEQLDEWWRRMQSSDAADLTAQVGEDRDDARNLAVACRRCNQDKGKGPDAAGPQDARAHAVVAALLAKRLTRWRPLPDRSTH
jgi:hypothetical protein